VRAHDRCSFSTKGAVSGSPLDAQLAIEMDDREASWTVLRERRDARIAEIGVAELALDDIERHAFAGMERGEFVRRTGLSGDAARCRASAARRRAEEHADRLEREREEWTRAAVAAERARIARDLHDVIAHSASVMTVQGGAARLPLDSDDRVAREPLLVVEETGRQALAGMRRLLGIVHSEPGRDPALAPPVRHGDLDRPLPGKGGGRPPTGRTASDGDGRPAGSGVP
jgi:signal transduction histidine kinase